jgi:regulator of sigma E protease
MLYIVLLKIECEEKMQFLLSSLEYIIPFILVLSVLIFVHEVGHYIVAKWCGVKIEEFSLGFGKKLISRFDKSGTEWKICAVPFGGYVKMFGDSDGSSKPDDEKIKNMTEEEKEVSFPYKKLYQKSAIVFAGPFFNYIFAIMCFLFLFMTYGEQFTKPIVSEIKADSAASISGLQINDEIVEFNGDKIEKFEDVQAIASLNFEKEMPISVKRGEDIINLYITPKAETIKNIFGTEEKRGLIGIISYDVSFIRHSNIFIAISRAFENANKIMLGTLKAVGQMITGQRSSAELGGPLKIAKLSKDFASRGAASLIYFISVLSLNLGLINLFPVPVLDGGHLLFFGIEALIRKPVNAKIQDVLFKIGMGLILILAIFITFNDLKSLSIIDFIKNLFYK